MSAPIVAIVGRPNVGKSTLFNRLVRARAAIVEDNPGVTRDRMYGVAEWDGKRFGVIDTGGIDPSLDTGLPADIRLQAEVAIDEADVLLFVVDAKDGLTATDQDIAELLRRSGKPLMVVANKSDSQSRENEAAAFHELGLGEVWAISAAHGRNTADFLDALITRIAAIKPLDPATGQVEVIPPGIRIAFLGRPNAGKSSLVNALLRQHRVIVSDQPGTTRDPVHLPFRWRERDLVLIDTAGLRRRKQIARAQEKLAAIKSIRAMERTQVVMLVIDAAEGVTDQDQRIARMAFERGKGVVVLLHKWDQVVGDKKLAHERMQQLEDTLGFLERPHVVKTSLVGEGREQGLARAFNLDDALEAAVITAGALERRIPTADLNDELQRAVHDHSPPMFQAKPVKLYFATQAESEPPLLVISANKGRCLHPSWERYFMRRVRDRWELWGVPVRLVVRARGQGNTERAAQTAAEVARRERAARVPRSHAERAQRGREAEPDATGDGALAGDGEG